MTLRRLLSSLALLLGTGWLATARLGAAESAAPGGGATNLTVLVFGDSLAAGYGVEPGEAWPAHLQKRITAAGLPATVVNAGVSGDTTAGGVRRIEWQLRRRVDVLVLELGGNDGLRGIAPENTRSNLVAIIGKVRTRWPDVRVVLAGMQMPTTMGPDYTARFAAVFPEVAKAEKAALIPHLLEGVGGVPELNQPDQIHPTAEGHRRVAENVWKVLEPVLRRSPDFPGP